MGEIRSITCKERAQSGASLPMALLLFLICALTASVVLTAGTAVAGRAADLPESDQAYYGVASALNMFRDQLMGDNDEGHEIMVAVKTSTPTGSNPTFQVAVTTDGKPAGSTFSVLERAALFLLFGQSGINNTSAAQTAAATYFSSTEHPWSTWTGQADFASGDVEEFTIEHQAEDLSTAQKETLALKGKATIDNGGDLVFTLWKPVGTGANESSMATFNLTCNTAVESGIIESTEAGDDVEIKYVTITWTPSTMEKG